MEDAVDVAPAGTKSMLVDVEENGADLLDLPADVLRSAYADLAPDDVRRQPYPLTVVADAIKAVDNRRRWTNQGVDVLALRLQYGRRMGTADVAALFSLAQKMVQQRVRDGKWSHAMSDANRADMARHVWLAGLARLGRECEATPGFQVTAAALQSLRDASAWQTLPPEKAMWEPVDGSAHELAPRPPVSQHALEKQSLRDNPANPDRTYRDKVAANLERLIAKLERQQREKAEAAAAEAGTVNDSEGQKAQQ